MQSHTESAQTLYLLCHYQNRDFFLHTFPINNIFWPGGLLTFYDPFLIKATQSENLFSLEVFLLYFPQPQKILNKVTFSWSKGAVGHNKERTN